METMPTSPSPLTRRYPTYPIDPSVNLLPNVNPAEDYGARTVAEIDRETQQIDLTMYRLTDIGICDALIRARGPRDTGASTG
jgi:hypothetical protein